MGDFLHLLAVGLKSLAVLAILAVVVLGLTTPVPLAYNVRSVFVRWRGTVATVLGIALVVAVYVVVQSMSEGLKKSNARTGDPRNLMVVRKGSTGESSSLVTREQLRVLSFSPEIERNAAGQPVISADVLVIANLPRRAPAEGEANVLLRGLTPRGVELRPQVRLVSGRWFEPGKREVVVSQRLGGRFANFDIGDTFKTGPARLTVVGWFSADQSAFDSEVWMDADECRAVFDRDMYSSLLMRPVDEAARQRLIKRVEEDKRLQLRALPEVEYYTSQTMTAKPIQWLGNFLGWAMSLGAICAAMNTMYASVGARTREIGTLRVLGFRRRTVVVSFLIEGGLLALVGGVLGCALALPMNGFAAGTMGLESFSETMFLFAVTPALVLEGLVFSVVVGLLGSLLPALRASRLPVIAALKSV